MSMRIDDLMIEIKASGLDGDDLRPAAAIRLVDEIQALRKRAAALREALEKVGLSTPQHPYFADGADFDALKNLARVAIAADSSAPCEHAWRYERTAQQEEYRICKACGKVVDSAKGEQGGEDGCSLEAYDKVREQGGEHD